MQLHTIDTHLVVALHALLQERSVTAAARRLRLTQPSLSHALARLRVHFDDPLLVKAGREMTLTERAAALLAPTAEAIAGLERVFAPAAPFDARSSQRVFTVATTDNLGVFVLPELVRRLALEAPGVKLRCHELGADWRERLARGELDLKLGRREAQPQGFQSMPLLRDRWVCLLRRGHPAARRPLTAARYAALGHLLVAPRGTELGVVDKALAARGLAREVVLTVPHFLVAPFVIARSDLALTISARIAEALAAPLGLVVRPCPLKLPEYVLAQVWAKRSEHDEGHRWLRERVRAVCGPAA